jgi:hypothetical protein
MVLKPLCHEGTYSNGVGCGKWTHIDGRSESVIEYIRVLGADGRGELRRAGQAEISSALSRCFGAMRDHCGVSSKRSCASISTILREYIRGKYRPSSQSGSRSE